MLPFSQRSGVNSPFLEHIVKPQICQVSDALQGLPLYLGLQLSDNRIVVLEFLPEVLIDVGLVLRLLLGLRLYLCLLPY